MRAVRFAGGDLVGVQAGGVLEKPGQRGVAEVLLARRLGRRGTASAGPRARVRRRGAPRASGSCRGAAGGGRRGRRRASPSATTTCPSERPAQLAADALESARRTARAGRGLPAADASSSVRRARWPVIRSPSWASRASATTRLAVAVPTPRLGEPTARRNACASARVGQQRRGRRARRGPRRARTGRGAEHPVRDPGARRARPAPARSRTRCARAPAPRSAAMPSASASAIAAATQSASWRSEAVRDHAHLAAGAAHRDQRLRAAARWLCATHATAGSRISARQRKLRPSTIVRWPGNRSPNASMLRGSAPREL